MRRLEVTLRTFERIATDRASGATRKTAGSCVWQRP